MTQPTPASTPYRLAAVYQLKIHLVGISPHICRRVLVRGDTTLAELHHVFQVAMGWENWHLHSFHLWGKEYGIPYVGGTYFADDARRVHLGDFPWRVNDKFTLHLRLRRLLAAPSAGLSVRNTAKLCDVAINTVRKVKALL